MSYFLCSECNDINCVVFDAPILLDMQLMPNRCPQSRKKPPKWQKYAKTVNLFKACKEGSELVVLKIDHEPDVPGVWQE